MAIKQKWRWCDHETGFKAQEAIIREIKDLFHMIN